MTPRRHARTRAQVAQRIRAMVREADEQIARELAATKPTKKIVFHRNYRDEIDDTPSHILRREP